MEKIQSLPESNKAEITLKRALKTVMGTFLQQHMPEFRFTSKRLQSCFASPLVRILSICSTCDLGFFLMIVCLDEEGID